jgi:hypothetical protein
MFCACVHREDFLSSFALNIHGHRTKSYVTCLCSVPIFPTFIRRVINIIRDQCLLIQGRGYEHTYVSDENYKQIFLKRPLGSPRLRWKNNTKIETMKYCGRV